MTQNMKKYLTDLAERVFWTAAEVIVGYVSIDALGLPKPWVPVAATVLAAAKGVVAKHIGADDSAAIAPGGS